MQPLPVPSSRRINCCVSVTDYVASRFETAREHMVQIVKAQPGDKARGGIPFDER